MVQSPSWEANWFAASQEILGILWNLKVHYHTHPSLSWASPIQSIYPHPTYWRSILILFTHLCLGLPSGLLPSAFPTKTLYTDSSHPYAPHAQPISFFWIIYIYIYIRIRRRRKRSINNAAVLRNFTRSLVTRVRKPFQGDGGHFEKFAWVNSKCTFNNVAQ